MKNLIVTPNREQSLFSDNPITDWRLFYDRVFNCPLDTDQIEIPVMSLEFEWLIVVTAGLTIPYVIKVCEQFFPVTLDGADEHQVDLFITQHDRLPYQSYAVWVRAGMEADRVHDGKSANQFDESGKKGMTLLERLLLGLYVYWKTGEHLDENTITICSGSRYVDGGVPIASWNRIGGLQITWHRLDQKWYTLACREAWIR